MQESCRQAWLSGRCHLYRQGSGGWIRRRDRAFRKDHRDVRGLWLAPDERRGFR